MGKIYTVVFNSSMGDGSVTNNKSYFFDWSNLEEGRYKCEFSFMSGHNPASYADGNNVANIFMDLGQSSNTVFATGSSGTNYLGTYIGSLETRSLITNTGGTANVNYYYASTVTNPPFYIDSKPRNNRVQITMYTNSATQSTLFTPVCGPYTLTLQLHKID